MLERELLSKSIAPEYITIVIKMLSFVLLSILLTQFVNVEPFPHKETEILNWKDLQEVISSENGCQCSGDSCACCIHADVPRIHLNDTVCVGVDYLPEEVGVDVKLTLDGKTLIMEKISLRNPPPLCVGIPHLEKYASICIDFYNVTISSEVGACVKLQVQFAGYTIEQLNIGCFHFPTNRKIYETSA